MGFFWRLSALAILLVGCQASAAQIDRFSYDAWSGSAFTHDKTGKFSHCVVSADYKNGMILLVSVGAGSGNVSIGFASPQWHLKVGEISTIDMRIDSKFQREVPAVATLENLLTVTFQREAELYQVLRKGMSLTISY